MSTSESMTIAHHKYFLRFRNGKNEQVINIKDCDIDYSEIDKYNYCLVHNLTITAHKHKEQQCAIKQYE
jgi:hypothetical protein